MRSKRSHSKEVIPERNNADIVGSKHEDLKSNGQHDPVSPAQNGAKALDMETERCPPKKSNVLKSRSSSSGSKSQKLGKSMVEFSKDQMCSRTENTGQIDDELGANHRN
ncbi:hypothetical protein Hdeb2414_s0016g00496121 [Helianthus debilis subsp. tardiflorus]